MSARHIFTVGPSALHPRYLSFYTKAIEQGLGSVYHRSSEFHGLYRRADEALRTLMNLDEDWMIFFGDSGSELWERILLNLSRNRTHHLVNGAFSNRFRQYALALGRKTSYSEAPRGQGFEWHALELPPETELLTAVLNETSTGVQLPAEGLLRLKERYPGTRLAVDAVSIAPFGDLARCGADTFFFSVQKCFGMPPGLGVWAVHRSVLSSAVAAGNGAHHTLQAFEKNYRNFETPSTPNTLAIAVLADIAEDFLNRGPDLIREQLRNRASSLYAFAAASPLLQPLVQEPANRSFSILVIRCTVQRDDLLHFLEKRGVMISSGYGDLQADEIRIGNFPAQTEPEWNSLMDALRAAEDFFQTGQ